MIKRAIKSIVAFAAFASAIVALLEYLNIDARKLAELAASLRPALPFITLFVGGFVGFCLKAYLDRSSTPSVYTLELTPTNEEIVDSFHKAPFELKLILKTALIHGPIYRQTESMDAFGHWALADKFLDSCNIRNGLCRCSVKSKMLAQFNAMPELLADVEEIDMSKHAFSGNIGDVPWEMDSQCRWWYYVN